MKEEIRVAASALSRLLQLTSSSSLSAEDLAAFESALIEVLTEQYTDHWHVEEPLKGHAYRCLRVNMFDRVDPLFSEAARRASIRFEALALPDEITIWVDPNDVTLKIGEDKSFSWALYTVRSGKCESLLDSIDFVEVLQRAEELRECDPKWIVFRQSGVRANVRGVPGRGDRKDSVNVRAGDSSLSTNSREVNNAISSGYLSNATMYNQHAANASQAGQFGYPNANNYYYDSTYYYYSQFCGYDDYGASSMNYSAAQAQPYYVPSQKHGRNSNVPNGNPNGSPSGAYSTEHGMQHRSRAGTTGGGYSKLGGSPIPNGMIGRNGASINGFHRSAPLGGGRDSPVKSPARFTTALAAKSNLAVALGNPVSASNVDELSHNANASTAVEPLF